MTLPSPQVTVSLRETIRSEPPETDTLFGELHSSSLFPEP